MTITRMSPTERKKQLLDVAVNLAARDGFINLRMLQVATAAQCSNATVVGYFKTMNNLRRAVMRQAVKAGVLSIIGEGIIMRDPVAIKVPADVRQKALAALAG